MGQHTAAVRCMEFCNTMRVTVSGGWDNLLKVNSKLLINSKKYSKFSFGTSVP